MRYLWPIKLLECCHPLNDLSIPKNGKVFIICFPLTGMLKRAEFQYLIRDHDADKFDKKKKLLQEVVQLVNFEYGRKLVDLEITDQYYNMREKIAPVMHIVDVAQKAMEQAGVKPIVKPIRGGTDGARLSYDGLPCPNVFAGGHNFHGPFEFVPIPSMLKAVEVILNIAQLATGTIRNS